MDYINLKRLGLAVIGSGPIFSAAKSFAGGANWFQLIVEAAPNAMLMVSSERKIILINRATEVLFDYSREDLIGESLELLIPDRFRARHPDHVQNYFSNPHTRSMGACRELYGRRRDGREVPIEIGLNPLTTPDGTFILASIIDITERRAAEEIRQQMAALIESAEDAIIVKDLNGVIRSWNPGAERLLGYNSKEAVGQLTKVLVPDYKADEEAEFLQKIKRGERVSSIETVRKRKDGSMVDVSLTVSPIRDHLGVIVGASKIMHDITERKKNEAELQRSNAELEQFAYIGPQLHDSLSKRELEIFILIANGHAIKEIASNLSLSEKTVSTYLARIRQKTRLISSVEIARYALLNGLVE